VVVHLLAARKTRSCANKTDQVIECGMDPIGDAWIRYSAVYYLYALIFVAFAVDVLFLIPVPWAGPVAAPITVSLALIGFGLAAAKRVGQGRALRVSLPEAVMALAGGLLVIASFTIDVPDGVRDVSPPWHPWPLFLAGMALAAWAGAMTLRTGAAGAAGRAAPAGAAEEAS
jgi:NADH:ubiquinone oxidoreductase subunit 3 (subunit A)